MDISQLEIKLDEIAEVIKKDLEKQKDIGVLDGLSGLAIFAFEYGKFRNNESFYDLGGDILAVCINRINEGYGVPTFCSGIAGFCWTLLYLEQNSFIDIDLDGILDPLEDYLFSCMKKDLEIGNYDYLHGALGYGMYFLKRHQNCKNENRNEYLIKLKFLANSMYDIAQKSDENLKWKSKLTHESNLIGFNLSLSHGMSSIVNFFLRLSTLEELHEISEKIYLGAYNFILSSKNNSNSESIFPSWTLSDNSQSTESRIGWCYGDFGIGMTLLLLYEKTGNEELKSFVKHLFVNCMKRTKNPSQDIFDAGFCHGSFGIAYIYHLLNQNEDLDIEVYPFIEIWVRNGLEFAKFNDGTAGFKQFNPNFGNPIYINQWNLLEGISGIGLVLMDILSKKKGKWAECLLL
jgi:lantibiotic modifying enzyme